MDTILFWFRLFQRCHSGIRWKSKEIYTLNCPIYIRNVERNQWKVFLSSRKFLSLRFGLICHSNNLSSVLLLHHHRHSRGEKENYPPFQYFPQNGKFFVEKLCHFPGLCKFLTFSTSLGLLPLGPPARLITIEVPTPTPQRRNAGYASATILIWNILIKWANSLLFNSIREKH